MDLHDVDRRRQRLLAGLAVELAEAVERRAAHGGHAELADLRKLHGVALARPDGLAGVEADFLGVDVERGDSSMSRKWSPPSTTCMRPGTSSDGSASL